MPLLLYWWWSSLHQKIVWEIDNTADIFKKLRPPVIWLDDDQAIGCDKRREEEPTLEITDGKKTNVFTFDMESMYVIG